MIKNYDDKKLDEIVRTRTKKGLIALMVIVIVLFAKLIIG